MMLNKLLLLLSLVACLGSQPSRADEIQEASMDFATGRWSQMKWHPSAYPEDGATYDVYYYIPRNLKKIRRHPNGYPALVFLHGGGLSTTSPQGSTDAINLYKNTLIKLADALDVAVVLPSGTGMNWGTHTPYYMRSLIKMMRSSLNVDPDRIGIAGHSMGGMAMTRIFYQIPDQVAFVMPLAAGLADLHKVTLQTHFNTPYYHLQGRKDAFDVFVTRCEAHEKAVKDLEVKFNQKSKFTMEFTDDDHSGVLSRFADRASKLFETPRDLYQTKLFGFLYPVNQHTEVDVGQKITVSPQSRYFWLETTDISAGPTKSIDFIAEVKDNVYQINFDDVSQTPKSLRIYLSTKMVDFTKDIKVYVNGKLVTTRLASGAPTEESTQVFAELFQDDGFRFEEKLDVKVSL